MASTRSSEAQQSLNAKKNSQQIRLGKCAPPRLKADPHKRLWESKKTGKERGWGQENARVLGKEGTCGQLCSCSCHEVLLNCNLGAGALKKNAVP